MAIPLYSPPISAQMGYCDNHEAMHIDMVVLQPLSVSGNRSGAKSSARMACAFSIYTRPWQYHRPPVCYMAFLTGAMSSMLKSARFWRNRCICAPRSRLGGRFFLFAVAICVAMRLPIGHLARCFFIRLRFGGSGNPMRKVSIFL